MDCVIVGDDGGRSRVHSRAHERLLSAGPLAFQQAMARLSPECAVLASHAAFPEGFVRLQRPFGHAAPYVADGAARLGVEVAHEALARDDCSAKRLRNYETIRRQANERSLFFSRRGTQVFNALSVFPWLAPVFPWFIRTNDRPDVKRRLLRALASAFASPNRENPSSP